VSPRVAKKFTNDVCNSALRYWLVALAVLAVTHLKSATDSSLRNVLCEHSDAFWLL
jgi:hypothetical protein